MPRTRSENTRNLRRINHGNICDEIEKKRKAFKVYSEDILSYILIFASKKDLSIFISKFTLNTTSKGIKKSEQSTNRFLLNGFLKLGRVKERQSRRAQDWIQSLI